MGSLIEGFAVGLREILFELAQLRGTGFHA